MASDSLAPVVPRDLLTRARRSALRGVALVGLLVAAGSISIALTDPAVDADLGRPIVIVPLLAWVVVAYLAGGVVMLRRAPEQPLGLLLIAAALASAAGALAWSTSSLPFTLGQAVDKLPQAVFLHVFLGFPDGRLTSRGERWLVGLGYTVALVLEPLRMVFGDYGSRNLLGVLPDTGVHTLVRRSELVLLSAACLVGVALLLRRRSGRRTPTWRWLSVVHGGFVASLVMIAVLDQLLAWGGLRALGVRELRWAAFWTLGMVPAALVAGLLEARLARSAVSDVLAQLWDGSSAGHLRDALARVLHDPGLRLLYWLPDSRRWATADGDPAELPDGIDDRRATVIDQDGVPLAAMVHDASLQQERDLLAAVAAAAGMALENGRLHAELRARVQEVTRSRLRVLEAARRERQRLERDLHDGAQQRLVTLSLELGLLQTILVDDPEARSTVARIKREIGIALEELRALARGIYPAVLSDHGLEVALLSLPATAAVPLRLEIDLEGERPPVAVEMAAFLVARESVTAAAVAGPIGGISLTVACRHGLVTVQSEPDGVLPPSDTTATDTTGTDAPATDDAGTRADVTAGFRALADRIEALGGSLRVGRTSEGRTNVRAEIPCG
jgi:signal transduction histidine kinase